jgi:hypothetical protein
MQSMKFTTALLLFVLSACNSLPKSTELVGANTDYIDAYSLPVPEPRPVYTYHPSHESAPVLPSTENNSRPVAYASPPFGGRVPTDKMVVDKGLECLADIKKALSQKASKEIHVEIKYPFVQKLNNNPSDEYWEFEADVSNNYSQIVHGYEATASINLIVIYSSIKSFNPICSSTSKVKDLRATSTAKPKVTPTPKPIKTAIPFSDLPVVGKTIGK